MFTSSPLVPQTLAGPSAIAASVAAAPPPAAPIPSSPAHLRIRPSGAVEAAVA